MLSLIVLGFPGSDWLAKVPPAWNIPIHAIVVSATFTSILSLINLGMSDFLGSIDLAFSRVTNSQVRNNRVIHCLQRFQLSRHGLNPVLLHHHDRLPYLASLVWQASAV